MKESVIQKHILQYLKQLGAHTIKTISNSRSGEPDIIACYNGRFIGLEVKAEKGRVTPLQLAKLRSIKSAGGIAAVVRSVEDVDSLFHTSPTISPFTDEIELLKGRK